MDILSILDGIRDKFRSDMGVGSVYALVDGKLYMNPTEAEDFAPAYIVVTVVDVVNEGVFEVSGDIERARLQFDIYTRSESVAEGGAILQALDALYQNADFGYATTYQHVNMRRIATRILREDLYWRFSTDYLLTIHET